MAGATHILFRADGDSKTGLGHLYRILALMELLKETFSCTLLSRSEGCREIVPFGFECLLIPSGIDTEQEPAWFSEHFPASYHRIVADGYQFGVGWQRAIRQEGYHLSYIDDLGGACLADLVINHSLAARPSDYQIPFYTRLALGARYAILRPPFLEAAAKQRIIKQVSAALVCFGGADPGDLTRKVAEALLQFQEISHIHVILGAAYPHHAIYVLQEQHQRIHIHQNLGEQALLAVMQQCDMAIASASTVLYELCTVKMPVLAGYYVANQENLYEGCLENGLIFPAGNIAKASTGDFVSNIKTVLRQGDYQPYLNAQQSLFDARIRERFLDLFTPIAYRHATNDDMQLIYDWANDKLSRENSYFSESIPLETHQRWFEKKLADPSTLIYIAEVEGIPAGMVRYELQADHTVVGISVAERFRGRQLAPEFLKGTALLYFEKHSLPVHAFIKQQNTASLRSFEKAGYTRLREEVVHGANSFIYKLEKHDVQ